MVYLGIIPRRVSTEKNAGECVSRFVASHMYNWVKTPLTLW